MLVSSLPMRVRVSPERVHPPPSELRHKWLRRKLGERKTVGQWGQYLLQIAEVGFNPPLTSSWNPPSFQTALVTRAKYDNSLKMGGNTGDSMDHRELMTEWQSGDPEAGDSLINDIHRELEAIASAKLAQEMHSSLSTGDLIDEAVIRLARLNEMEFKSRAHILALTARLMRQILIDQARRRNADKRYYTKVTLQTNIGEWQMPVELPALDMHLTELCAIDSQRADIVEMRFFGGMTLTDISTVLDISVATVKRRWPIGLRGCALLARRTRPPKFLKCSYLSPDDRYAKLGTTLRRNTCYPTNNSARRDKSASIS